MSEELKPCPFCGGDASLIVKTFFGLPEEDVYTVACNDCKSQSCYSDDHKETIKIWNTRPAEDALKAEVERLKAVLAEIAATLATGAEVSEDDIFTMCKDAVGEKEVLDRYNEKLRERGRG
jgi:Lar family restriction alleviation protein